MFLRQAAGRRGSGHERFAEPPDSVQTSRVGGSAAAAMVPLRGLPLMSSTARFGYAVARDAAFAVVNLLFWRSLRAEGNNGRGTLKVYRADQQSGGAHHTEASL